MTKIRVLLCTTRPTQFEVPLYRYLSAQAGVDVHVWYATNPTNQHTYDAELSRTIDWGMELTEGYQWQCPAGQSQASVLASLLGTLRRSRYDLIVVPGWSPAWAAVASAFCLVTGKPLGLNIDSSSLHVQGGLGRSLSRRALFRVLAALDTSFLCKGSESDRYIRGYADRARTFRYPYSVDVEWWQSRVQEALPRRGAVRSELGVPNDGFVLLAVAKFVERETPLSLIEAIGRLSPADNVRLVLVGDGPLRHRLAAASEGFSDRVLLPGYLPYTELPNYYAMADAFLHPAVAEPWGVSVGEAAASSLPILCSTGVGSGHDLVWDGVNGFRYCPDDIETLCELISRLAHTDAEVLKQMGAMSWKISTSWTFSRNYRALVEAASEARFRRERRTSDV